MQVNKKTTYILELDENEISNLRWVLSNASAIFEKYDEYKKEMEASDNWLYKLPKV